MWQRHKCRHKSEPNDIKTWEKIQFKKSWWLKFLALKQSIFYRRVFPWACTCNYVRSIVSISTYKSPGPFTARMTQIGSEMLRVEWPLQMRFCLRDKNENILPRFYKKTEKPFSFGQRSWGINIQLGWTGKSFHVEVEVSGVLSTEHNGVTLIMSLWRSIRAI